MSIFLEVLIWLDYAYSKFIKFKTLGDKNMLPLLAGLASYLPSLAVGGGLVGLGALAGKSKTFGGTEGKFEQVQRFNPQQQGALQQLLGMGFGGLQNPTQGFQPIKERALSTYQNQVIPSIAERFTSMGGHGSGALSSPAFASQLGQSSSDLTQGLAGMEAQYGQNAIAQLLQILNLGLTPQFEQAYRPGTTGLLGPLLQGLGSGVGQYGASKLGGLI